MGHHLPGQGKAVAEIIAADKSKHIAVMIQDDKIMLVARRETCYLAECYSVALNLLR